MGLNILVTPTALISCNGISCILWDYLPNNIRYCEYLCGRLSNLISDTSKQCTVFTTVWYFGKPVTKPYSRNEYFCGHASKRAPKLFSVCCDRTRHICSRFFSIKEPNGNKSVSQLLLICQYLKHSHLVSGLGMGGATVPLSHASSRCGVHKLN